MAERLTTDTIGGVEYTLRLYSHPGKYEGELAIAEVLHMLAGDGCDDETGSVEYGGHWYGRLNGPFRSEGSFVEICATARIEHAITADELSYLARLAGVILSESSQGFVSVRYFDDPAVLSAEWDRIVAETAEDDDSGADDDSAEGY